MNRFLLLLAAALAVVCQPSLKADDVIKPNVIIILADDLGYGDLSCYGATVIQTPNIDSLASQGIRFTQGFATNSTCTPSRYSLITGKYSFRREGVQILPGDAPLLIEPGTLTLPEMFRKAGYTTGVVGKWHLGLGRGKIDWNAHIAPGPNEVGFDSAFIMAATVDRTPTVYIRDGNVVNLDPSDPLYVDYKKNFDGEPTYVSNPELVTKQKSLRGHNNSVHNGVGRIGFQKGGCAARWVDETMGEVFKSEAEKFIRRSAAGDKPFFLYYALHQPHGPRMPGERFAGKSPLGVRGDAILEADWQVGEVMRLLDELHLTENTIVIFTLDNGPVVNDGYLDQSIVLNDKTGHKPSGNLRGGKYSPYNGGSQVPFIVYWAGSKSSLPMRAFERERLQQNAFDGCDVELSSHDAPVLSGTSDALVCQMDFLASFAAMLGVKSKELASLDSQNVMPALLGLSSDGRKELIVNGNTLRTPRWHYVSNQHFPSIMDTSYPELYDLSVDPEEKNDLLRKNPYLAKELGLELRFFQIRENFQIRDKD